MAAPALVSSSVSTFSDSYTTDESAGSVSWEAGDIVLVWGSISNNNSGFTLSTPTVTGLTFSLATSVNVNNDNNDTQQYLWSATAAGSGSGAIACVTNGASGTLRAGIAVQVWRGSDGLGTPVTIDGSTAKTISVTTTQANSVVMWGMSDWNQVGDATVTATPSGTVQHASAESGQADFFAGYTGDLGSIGTYACGIASHTGTVDMSGIAVEVKGTAGGGGGSAHRKVGSIPIGTKVGGLLVSRSRLLLPAWCSKTNRELLAA